MTDVISGPARFSFEAWQPGPLLDFPGFALAEGPIACPAPATVTVEERSFVLEHRKPRCLRYAHIGARVAVRRRDAVLVEGLDYTVDRARGIVGGVPGRDPVKVSISYEATSQRVDCVVADVGGRIKLVRGTEVPRLAQQFEPGIDAELRTMFRIYRTAAGCDIQPVHLFRGATRIDAADAYAAAIQRSRECLSGFVRERLRPGAHLRWGAYGDSITALGVTTLPVLNRCPNVHRDLDAIFRNYDEAALRGVPRYRFDELYPEDVPALIASGELDSDGSDTYGRRHVKVSQHWQLIEWLKSRFGVSVAYRNWGVGATHSGPGVGRDGLMHMSHPERLAVILDDSLDVVNIAAGMNELGEPSTYGNLMHIGSQFMRRGTLVILSTPLRRHPASRFRIDDWRKTCDDIERASRDLGCASVQSRHAFDDAGLAGWLARDELCAANANNHPGIKELAMAGELAIDLFR